MSGFLRMFLLGMGYLGLLLAVGGVTLVMLLKMNGVLPEKLRQWTLTDADRELLEKRDRSVGAPPPVDPELIRDQADEQYRRVADQINQDSVKELLEQLAQREADLGLRGEMLDRREAEDRLRRADLARLEAGFLQHKEQVHKMLQQLAAERSEWAEFKLKEHQRYQVLREVDKAQWQANALRYQDMKEPWALLKQLPVEDIAKILALMEGKKAARILDTAVRDQSAADLPVQLHKKMLVLDLDGLSAGQAAQLAKLYDYVGSEQVVDLLAASPAEEIVAILAYMDPKKSATVLATLSARHPELGGRVAAQWNLAKAGNPETP